MAYSLPLRPRPGRKSVMAASSPASAGQSDADVTGGRGSPSIRSALNGKIESDVATTPPIRPTFLLQYSLANKLSDESFSSTEMDSGFDSPVSSPLYDSNPTSPEEDDSTSIPNKGKLSTSPRRTQLARADDNSQHPLEPESPTVAVQKRRKSSTKAGPTRSSPRRASRVSESLEVPPEGRQRASSAPEITPPVKPGSCHESPICLSSDDDQPSISFGSLALKEVKDTKKSARKGRSAATALATPISKQRNRASSTTGRVEERATNIVRDLDANELPESMDWESTSTASRHTSLPGSLTSSTKASPRQLTSPTGPSRSGDKRLTKRNNTPTISPEGSGSGLSSSVGTLRPSGSSLLVQQRDSKDGAERTEPVTPRRPSLKGSRPLEKPEVNLESASDTESQLGSPKEAQMRKLDTDIRKNDGRGAESDQSPEHNDLGDEGSEPLITSEPDEQGDTHPNSDAAPDEDPQNLDFQPRSDKEHNEKDTRLRLIRMMQKDIKNPKLDQKLGDIYIYTAAVCSGRFKVGLTRGPPGDRIAQQKACVFGAPKRVLDPEQRQFRYPRRVEDLIKLELDHLRREFPCKTCRKKSNKGPQVHGEWYEISQEQVLQVVGKWRRWMTMRVNNPYDSEGRLTPRWRWKIERYEERQEGVDLDSLLQPFTELEEDMYRKEWPVRLYQYLSTQGKEFIGALRKSNLFLFIFLAWPFLVYTLGLPASLGISALLAIMVACTS